MPEERVRIVNPDNWNVHAASHVGGRKQNEDYALIHRNLFIVADGVGGGPAGEVASKEGTEALARAYLQLRRRYPYTAQRLSASLSLAQKHLQRLAEAPERRGMGTAITAAAIDSNDGLHAVHLGDTRLYVLRRGDFMPITVDHSIPELLYQQGKLEEDEIATHPDEGKMHRSLGADRASHDYVKLVLRRGDRILLCSDGVYKVLPVTILKGLLASEESARKVAGLIVRTAQTMGDTKYKGQHDNITALVYFHKH
jgi:protein phosphatase